MEIGTTKYKITFEYAIANLPRKDGISIRIYRHSKTRILKFYFEK